MPEQRPPRSPDQLDQQIALVRAPGWLAAAALVIIAATAIAWSVFGTVLVQVSGEGLLVTARNATATVQAESAARLMRVFVNGGQHVKAGDLMFTLSDPALEQKRTDALTRVAELEDHMRTIDRQTQADMAERGSLAQKSRAALDQQEAQLQARIDFDTKYLADQQKLLGRGLTVRTAVESAQVNLDQARLLISNIASERAKIATDLLQASSSWQQLKLQEHLKLSDQQATLRDVEGTLKRAMRIVAPVDGIVEEVLANESELIKAGATLARIGTDLSGFEVLGFLDPYSGKRVTPGMEVEIVPATVARSEYGTMSGRVAYVSQRPVSVEEVTRLVGNDTIARFLTTGTPPIFVRIGVDTDGRTPSGFRWRNGSGPPFSVTPGTLARVAVNVESQAPITLILPYIRHVLGAS
ncbi:NHLP bacteriocin system secretion protein [Xanthobacteraceae bacterium A53D]